MPNLTASIPHPYAPTPAELDRELDEISQLIQQSRPTLHTPPSLNPIPAPEPPATPAPAATTIPSATPHLGEAALYGPAGLATRTIAPHTEAHPAAILLQILVVFGNLIGRGPHCLVDTTRHSLNLYLVLVGDSSKARKGTSWSQITRLFAQVGEPWQSAPITTARLTATGLLHTLRNQDPPTNRRLLALSEEFSSVLRSFKTGNGHLSPLLRCAWDTGDLPTLDMKKPTQATETHFSLIAHITQRELAHTLPRTETHNGFANRCLWAWIERGNCLPDGGSLTTTDLAPVAHELRRALDWAAATPEMLFRRDPAAAQLWQQLYPTLSQLQPGLRGAATSRAEAQVLRLSALYAALDSTSTIGLPHLQAALALWDYCSASATLLFGFSTGDPIADRIREALESAGQLSRSQIRRLFHGHIDGSRIDAALETLSELGALYSETAPTRGRPSTTWSVQPF